MKNQKTIKTRDPNWKDMEALRKSGAAGSHRDKKKEMKAHKMYCTDGAIHIAEAIKVNVSALRFD